MEDYVSSNTLGCQDISSKSGSSKGPSNLTDFNSGDLSTDELTTHLTEFLRIEEIDTSSNGSNLSPGKNKKSNVPLEDECKALDKGICSDSVPEKCISNCVGFPTPDKPKSAADVLTIEVNGQEDENTTKASGLTGSTKSGDQCHSQSTPTPLKLVSAMKGSRAKQGKSPKDTLSVTWAPDVYDPIPTSVSHFPSGKNQRYRNNNKRYGKNKQKGGGKSSRGNKGKDKKRQTQKNNGCNNNNNNNNAKCKQLKEDTVGFCDDHYHEIDDFNMASSDPFCGSSFMQNLHYPVTQAT